MSQTSTHTNAATCHAPDLPEIFPAYLSGNATEEEQQRIETHLASCPSCQGDMAFFLGVRAAWPELKFKGKSPGGGRPDSER